MKVRISIIDSATTIASAIKTMISSNEIGYIIPLLQSCGGGGVVGENKTTEGVDTHSVEDEKCVLSTE